MINYSKKKEIEKNQDKESDKDEFEFFSDDEIEVDVKKTKLKKLYRQIVKTTHPDKIKNDRLNELYLKATKYYSDNDFAGTYSICSELNIEFEVDDEERNLISDQILNMKNRIEFIEKTMSWRWFNSDDVQKQKIMFEYLKIRLNN